MGRIKGLLIPALLALLFILITAYIALNSMQNPSSVFAQFCIVFHFLPATISSSSSGIGLIILYYFILWILITFFFISIKRLLGLIFKGF
jgi:hypothetical protein